MADQTLIILPRAAQISLLHYVSRGEHFVPCQHSARLALHFNIQTVSTLRRYYNRVHLETLISIPYKLGDLGSKPTMDSVSPIERNTNSSLFHISFLEKEHI